MSLVNDMLRDLERSSARGTGTSGLRPAHQPARARHRWRAKWMTASLAALALGALVAEFEIRVVPDWRDPVAATGVLPVRAMTPPPVAAAPPLTSLERRPIPGPGPDGRGLAERLPAIRRTPPPPAPTISAVPPASPTPGTTALQELPPSLASIHPAPGIANEKRATRPTSRAQRAREAYREGIASLRSGDSRAAEAALSKALRLHPALRGARQRLAALRVSSGQLEEAARLLEDGLARTPAHPPFAAALARIRVENGALDEAVRLLEAALPGAASDPGIHAFLAALYQRRGDHVRAARSYSHALRQNPDRPLWWMGMGVSFESLGRSPDAFAAYQMARSRTRERDLPPASQRYLETRLRALGGEQP